MELRMQIRERRMGLVTILDLQGRLALDDGEVALRDCVDALIRVDRVHIVLNFNDVTGIDSGGIGLLVAKCLSVRRRGGDLKLLHLTDRSHRVLAITHLLSVFETFASEEEAIRSFTAKREPAA